LTGITSLLLTNFALIMSAVMLLWLYAVRIRDVSFIDAFWAFGMVMLGVTTFMQTEAGDPLRKRVMLALCALWGLRLANHLFTRWRAHGEDPRYKKILAHAVESKGWGWPKAALIMVFAMQGPMLFIVCLPVQLGQVSDAPMGLFGGLGVIVALIGIAFESIGDKQLNAFRADPANRGKVLDTGLWRYTRHPNYFGDACTWWGLYIIASEASPGIWALPGPLLLTWLLTKLSGVPMLERSLKKSRPGYADYVARTSGFFPLPPRK
jgi:steroid 5-alpha reductase family enzyme